MVDNQFLDPIFAALADATRREVLVRLGREGPTNISALAEPAGITVTGMSKHIRVLEDAGLVTTKKVGRARQCQLGSERLEAALSWIDMYQQLWERRLDGLDAYFTLNKGDEK